MTQECVPYGRQSISPEDIQAVVDVLQSDFLTQGPAVPAFEKGVSAYCGAGHAVAVNSATSALHIACMALGVGAGDLVWTSPITFVASANCALYCGADVDFVDIDPTTYNMSVAALAAKLEKADRQGRLPKVVIPVHLAGQSCDMAAIRGLADRYGFRIIEDASHAVGGRYRGEPVGNCRYSDIAIFSFHPVKIITTAEGGLALSNDAELARRMGLYRTHGITRAPEEMEAPAHGPWYYEQVALGFNYRMTDLQAALGSSQIKRLDAFVARRRALASAYDEAFRNQAVSYQWQHPDTESSWHLYILRWPGGAERRSRVFAALREAKIGVNLHYIPVYLQPYYRRLGFAPGHCPEAERYYEGAISIPVFPGMSDGEQQQVIQAVIAATHSETE